MANQAQTLHLQVNAFDVAELRELLPEEVEVVRDRPAGAHGEPVLIATMVLTPLVIQGITLWLLKQRRRVSVTVNAEKSFANGDRESVSFTVHMSESTSSRDVVEQVVAGMKLDPGLVETVSRLAT
jgi:hypothetical protein